jgi:hypothetical protein
LLQALTSPPESRPFTVTRGFAFVPVMKATRAGGVERGGAAIEVGVNERRGLDAGLLVVGLGLGLAGLERDLGIAAKIGGLERRRRRATQMTNEPGRNPGASVRQRLLTLCDSTGEVFNALQPRLPQRQVQQAISHVLAPQTREAKLRVVDDPADRRALRGKEHAAKVPGVFLPSGRNREKVRILRQQHSTEFGGPLQKLFVRRSVRSIILCGERINAFAPEALGHANGYVHVHVNRQRHARRQPWLPWAAARRRSSS